LRPAKTLEDHRDYLHRIVALKLWFLHGWLADHPNESFVHALRERVDIYRKTEANPGPMVPETIDWESQAWRSLEDGLQELYGKAVDDREGFERRGLALLTPSLDARCERDFTDSTVLAPYDCGCLRLDRQEAAPGVRGFHIANPLSPGSIFDDPRYLPACFLVLLEQAKLRFGVTEVTTKTWLNDSPRWLALFPQTWRDSLSGPSGEIAWHFGFWGQLLTSRGTFHTAAAAHLRQTGGFAFLPRSARASVEELRQHFAQTLARL